MATIPDGLDLVRSCKKGSGGGVEGGRGREEGGYLVS